jgi:Uma2 family endonuclease
MGQEETQAMTAHVTPTETALLSGEDLRAILVAEIVSPSDRWQAIEDTISDYFAAGVASVWVVHPRQSAVYVYHSRSERQRLDSDMTLQGTGVLEAFSLPVAALF